MKKVKVLDNGYIQLVDHLGTDASVVNAARVSYGKAVTGEISSGDIRLIGFLAEHNHWSPFAHAAISVRIKAPISTQRQWMKHRIGVENNSESTRYVVMKPDFYIPLHLRTQSKDTKQGSDGIMAAQQEELCIDGIVRHYCAAFDIYEQLVQQGVAREQARDILPLATYTTWVSTMSLYAAYRIYDQRTKDGAQYEISEYAKALAQIVEPLFPESWKALTT